MPWLGPKRFGAESLQPAVVVVRGRADTHHTGKYKRPYLFVMTLKYSGKSVRKVVWKTDQQIWAQLHEQAWRAFGGCTQYVVLDNLKEGVIHPDLYAPELNPVYSAMLAHYAEVPPVPPQG
ncbi:MAG: transposase [Ramlibacter sp.]|nr:transposase [Ramlibacter sp.]